MLIMKPFNLIEKKQNNLSQYLQSAGCIISYNNYIICLKLYIVVTKIIWYSTKQLLWKKKVLRNSWFCFLHWKSSKTNLHNVCSIEIITQNIHFAVYVNRLIRIRYMRNMRFNIINRPEEMSIQRAR